ncbi:hypothetical protein Clacol_000040 [Clathrus columnatus]|uniref:Uncharacterized protein n=1 Tax=Clathrus columnatus TaxID=1419009 RepID=A0AAV4ZXQ4_9AGAM|nr:hypothetical protein Clacol_000040 [Clathrus columnatus]
MTLVRPRLSISNEHNDIWIKTAVPWDGRPKFVGDGNDNNTFQFPLWNAQNLSNTSHAVTITNIPTKQGGILDIDFISIGREIGPPGFIGQTFNVTIDDESPFVMYNGSWSSFLFLSSSNAFNSTIHRTTEQDSSIFLKKLHNGLEENRTHSVTLMNSVSNPNRPLYFDYAISSFQHLAHIFSGDTPSPNASFTVPVTSSPSPSKSKIGVIVGGVVGGIAGLQVHTSSSFGILEAIEIRQCGTSPIRPHENNIMPQSSIMEEDTGPLGHVTLPPRYNTDWRSAIALRNSA